MSLHQIIAGLLNDYSYVSILQVLNAVTHEMFNHHSQNYNDMLTCHMESTFSSQESVFPHATDLSKVQSSDSLEEEATQMSIDLAMLSNQSEVKPEPKALQIKMSKPKPKRAVPVPQEPVVPITVTKTDEPQPEPQQTTAQPPKKLKKPVAKPKCV
jgi:hypothetical protein